MQGSAGQIRPRSAKLIDIVQVPSKNHADHLRHRRQPTRGRGLSTRPILTNLCRFIFCDKP